MEGTDKWLPLWNVCGVRKMGDHGCLTVFACKRKVIVDILVFIYLSFQLSCVKIKHYAF